MSSQALTSASRFITEWDFLTVHESQILKIIQPCEFISSAISPQWEICKFEPNLAMTPMLSLCTTLTTAKTLRVNSNGQDFCVRKYFFQFPRKKRFNSGVNTTSDVRGVIKRDFDFRSNINYYQIWNSIRTLAQGCIGSNMFLGFHTPLLINLYDSNNLGISPFLRN